MKAAAVNLTARSADDNTLPWLVAGYSDGTVRLFDLNRVEMTLKMHPHASSTTAVCFSADGLLHQHCIAIACHDCNLIH